MFSAMFPQQAFLQLEIFAVHQFWYISCRFDIEHMEWASTWELLKLCKLSNIYDPKASTSAWGFTFNNFFFLYLFNSRIPLSNSCFDKLFMVNCENLLNLINLCETLTQNWASGMVFDFTSITYWRLHAIVVQLVLLYVLLPFIFKWNITYIKKITKFQELYQVDVLDSLYSLAAKVVK